MRSVVLAVLLLSACGGVEREPGTVSRIDAGIATPDAGSQTDSGTIDAGMQADAASGLESWCITLCGTRAMPEPRVACVVAPIPCETAEYNGPTWCLGQVMTREVPADTPACDF